MRVCTCKCIDLDRRGSDEGLRGVFSRDHYDDLLEGLLEQSSGLVLSEASHLNPVHLATKRRPLVTHISATGINMCVCVCVRSVCVCDVAKFLAICAMHARG